MPVAGTLPFLPACIHSQPAFCKHRSFRLCFFWCLALFFKEICFLQNKHYPFSLSILYFSKDHKERKKICLHIVQGKGWKMARAEGTCRKNKSTSLRAVVTTYVFSIMNYECVKAKIGVHVLLCRI